MVRHYLYLHEPVESDLYSREVGQLITLRRKTIFPDGRPV